jgi:hypothetical protein
MQREVLSSTTTSRDRLRRSRGVSSGVMALAMVAALGLGLGCSSDDSDTGNGNDGGFTLEPFYAEDYLTSYVEVADCRSSIDGHNPNTVRVHVTPGQAQAYLDKEPLPEGTVIVKTETAGPPSACATDAVVRITSMRKAAAGTAPNSGDWEWQEFIFGSKPSEREGQLADCLACHTDPACAARDYTCIER